mgnify:FL=1
MRSNTITFLAASILISPSALANPIPVPVPASMPLEEMSIVIGGAGHVTFTGDFTFDFIPVGFCTGLNLPACEEVTKMQFPLPPENPSNVAVYQDGRELTPMPSPDIYPTVLQEHPMLPMFEWLGPFPLDGAIFTVKYEHDVFARDDTWVLFYSLGTGKYFPTYDKVTTALIDIFLPPSGELLEVLLDLTPVEPSAYTLTGNKLSISLTSDYGPFTKDLIVSYAIPEPASTWLIAVGIILLAQNRGSLRKFKSG